VRQIKFYRFIAQDGNCAHTNIEIGKHQDQT
jgi:hypothetical protein